MIRRRKIAAKAAAVAMTAAALGTLLVAQAVPQAVAVVAKTAASGADQVLPGTEIARYDAFDANQGVAVDKRYFYAVDNSTITKHDRITGEPLLQFAGDEDGPIEHLDSGVVVNGRLYASHSNYSEYPMESSIEIFDTRTMRHIGTHSFGIYRGSLTWLDRHDGAWWATFANYDRPRNGTEIPYGETYNTQVVKMDDDFQVVESWTIPKEILDRFDEMSNSGGSWGPDGRLWLTGHDLPEAYVMRLPEAGAELEWVATISLPGIQGQGIAWDDARQNSTLWGISRNSSEVLSYRIPVNDIEESDDDPWQVNGPGEFEE
ncbi:hypothetical protein [Jiangella mangrovi]|uniref:Uncharacterized protein n=1 Tax=Jiangella mangrovi TaxID=1524084 RepID=A0A7W9GY27_9ACTN|nr:hypothetical protein [Jiangella mangrovi]MBB5791858.1 hypothetical protein [Jiangella mangrovi]